jgi:hypothetical protein
MSSDNRFTDSSPFAAPQEPRGRRRSASRWILWVFLLGGAGFALLCCGGVSVVVFGLRMMSVEIRDQIRDNPRLREHVGEVQSFEIDMMESMAQEEDVYRYRVRGTKGEGELTLRHHTNDEGDEVIDEAWLRLPTGERIKVVPEDE